MTKGLMASTAEEIFKSPQGSHLDVIYGTSDGNFWFNPKDALGATAKLENKKVIPYYRDPEVREMAERHQGLKTMIHATDYLKLMKLNRKEPVYVDYTLNAEEYGLDPLDEKLFKFVWSKVFMSNRPNTIGMRNQIYMFGRGIVDAVFIRRYSQGVVWTVGDDIVFTCPTHTELSHGSYYELFPSFLTKPKQPVPISSV